MLQLSGADLFFGIVGFLFFGLAGVAIWDLLQKKHTLRHNFPVVAWARYILESQREKIQQYFIETSRAGQPYNLRQREWIYRSAKKLPSATGFGTDVDVLRPGSWYFLPSPFATLESEAPDEGPLPSLIGPHRPHAFQPKQWANISDMSYGSLGAHAVQSLTRGAHLSGVWLATGEGSISEHHLVADCDRVLEIGAGLFGVRELDGRFSMERFLALMEHAKAVTLKLSQGAKPGAGGMLPAAKITPEIARIRNIPMGEDCHSPSRFKEFHDVPSMFEWIKTLQDACGKPVGIKFCLGDRRFAVEVAELLAATPPGTGPDFIVLDGSEGGTGAAPMGLADNMGTPIREALPWLDNLLREKGVRDRVHIIAAGRFATGADVAFGLALGADSVYIARGFMMAMGCIQALLCHTNRCPAGITTHSKWLQSGLDPADKGVRVANYGLAIRSELMKLVRSMGLRSPAEITRHHCHLMQPNGASAPVVSLWPYPPGTDPAEKAASIKSVA